MQRLSRRRQHGFSRLVFLLAAVFLWGGMGRAWGASASCVGDCGGDGTVTVDEIVRGVNIALGALPVGECTALDRNGDESVTVDELVAAVVAALGGCPTPVPTTEAPTPTPTPTPTEMQSPPPTPTREVRFREVTREAGLLYTQFTLPPGEFCITGRPPLPGLCEPEYFSGGAAVGDFDGDEWPDLYVTRLDAPGLLFRNLGDGTFREVSAPAGLTGSACDRAGNGAGWADIDNDGDQDLYVTAIGSEARRYCLFVNDGTGHFTEEGLERDAVLLTPHPHYGFSVSFGDYDRDGYLDVHLNEWRTLVYNTDKAPSHTRLLHNLGAARPGAFEDVTADAGVAIDAVPSRSSSLGTGLAFTSQFADMDDDGWPDLLIAGDFGTSRLFWNNRNGTFTDGTTEAGVGSDENGMGSAVGDFDGDGRLDWFVASIRDPSGMCVEASTCNWGSSGNRLFRNTGGRRFSDQTDAAGVRDGGWGWGAASWDFDNDGRLDLVMTNGIRYSPILDELMRPSLDDAFENDPTRLWHNETVGMREEARAAGVSDTGSGKGLVTLDVDRDGDLDLFLVNNRGEPVLYRNDSSDENGWLQVKVVGSRSNRDGIGARVTVTDRDGHRQVREIDGGSNYLGNSERVAHFGLGTGSSPVPKVEIEWPASGESRVFEQVVPNTRLVAVEP